MQLADNNSPTIRDGAPILADCASSTALRPALLAGLGWRELTGLPPGRSDVRHWEGLDGQLERRDDGGRHIGRFRWDLPNADGGQQLLVQFCSLSDEGVHVTSATESGLVSDRHQLVARPAWDALQDVAASCRRVDPGVSDATIRRVLADRLRRDGIELDGEAWAFFVGLLTDGETIAHTLLGAQVGLVAH